MFCMGQCNASCLDIFWNTAINCFCKIRLVLKRTFKHFTAVVLKRTDCRHGSGSTMSAVLCQLSAEEAKAGLVAADVHTVRWWWLE